MYMAPEVIQQQPHGTKADIWSLGISAYEMTTGATPYYQHHPLKALRFIVNDPPPALHAKYGAKLRDFVSKCLVKDPKEVRAVFRVRILLDIPRRQTDKQKE